ncbi:flagellar assembly protein FliW [Nocardioides sp. InS609-2]|uniref:flagellar assembly protein FliW n=1 Tax=Nocardioides sp. InS609-2 TaxID=2760705 RepID=UPI0020BE0A16|nr:flagellar assembly protein FliW [Nocardioides sp. InS609-2]
MTQTQVREPVRSAMSPLSELSQIPMIEMSRPVPGFPQLSRFALVQLDDDGVLCALRSLDDPEMRFLVVSAVSFFPDYAPVVDDATVAELGIETVEDVLVLVVLSAGTSLAETTANLLAPILVNTRTLRGAQVILDDPALQLAAPLVA